MPSLTWRALRACETRIRDLHSLSVGGEAHLRRDAQLREEGHTALQLARTCALEGAFRRAGPAELAALVNSFARLRRFPLAQDIDPILAFVDQEVVARAAHKGLGDWTAKHLAMVTNGLSKSQDVEVKGALLHLARAFLQTRALTVDAGWTAQPLAMMASALSKGEGPHIQEVLAHLARALLARRPLTKEAGWTPQPLAMIANGLARGEGPDIRSALAHLAQVFVQEPELGARQGWSPQHLAMMASGLGKGEGAVIQEGLVHLARGIRRQELAAGHGWSAWHLAMVADGLSKGEGPEMAAVLTVIARVVRERDLTQAWEWTARCLATMAHALGRAQGEPVREALGALARSLSARSIAPGVAGWTPGCLAMMADGLSRAAWQADVQKALVQLAGVFLRARHLVAEAGWTPLNLSMMANGLARGRGGEVQHALARLVAAAFHRGLMPGGVWTDHDLLRMMGALSQAAEGTAFFDSLVAELEKRAEQEPGLLIMALKALCRLPVSDRHLEAARRLLAAFRQAGAVAAHPRVRDQLLWCTTLLHCASCQPPPADPSLSAFFAQSARHYRSCPVDSCTTGGAEACDDEPWHNRWAQAYWHLLSGRRATLVVCPAIGAGHRPQGLPLLQQTVFDRIRAGLPASELLREARINDFPVALLVDGHICIAVDGADHLVPMVQQGEDKPGCAAREAFVDHMLHQYGYRVFRVSGHLGPEALDTLVSQVRAALHERGQPVPETGQDSPERAGIL